MSFDPPSRSIGSSSATDRGDQHSRRGAGEYASSGAINKNGYTSPNQRTLCQLLDVPGLCS